MRVELRNDPRFTLAGLVLALFGGAVFALSAYVATPLMLPALAIGAAAAALAFARPAAGLVLVFLAMVGESVALPLPTGSLTPAEALLVVLGFGYVFRLVFAHESVVRPSVADLPFAGLLVVGFLGLTFAPNPAPVFRVVVLWLLFYCVFLQAQSFTLGEIRMVLVALAVGAGVLGAIGALHYLQSGNTVLYNGGEATGARATGTFDQANYYASVLQLALLPAIALLLSRARNWLLLIPVGAAFAGLAFSLSRGATLGFAVGLLVLLSWNRARWIGGLLVVLVIATTVANVNPIVKSQQFTTVEERLSTLGQANEETSTNSRPRIWAAAIAETEAHPFLGIGLNQFVGVSLRHDLTERGHPLENAHNIFLSLAVETGLLGLACFLLFLATVARRSIAALRATSPEARGIAVGLVATLTGFFVQGMTVNQLRDNVIAGTFLALAGLLVGLARANAPTAETTQT